MFYEQARFRLVTVPDNGDDILTACNTYVTS